MVSVGLDIGSTTVKAVVINENNKIQWKRYERHKTKQMEKVAEFLERITSDFGCSFRLFTTGSGGSRIAHDIGAKYFQEVNALSFAVEHFHPDVKTVFELGGQDAKFISWRDGKGKFSTMNDRCAGGTGATVDRIIMKLNLSEDRVSRMTYSPDKIYPVAGKCGVFAETDINSLQKQGIPEEALIFSLFHAIVEQNLAVLARGFTPEPGVLLLGGPNVFFPALKDAWEERLFALWRERNTPYQDSPNNSIYIPENALFYGAYGAALLGCMENESTYIVNNVSGLLRSAELKKKSHLKPKKSPFFRNKSEKDTFYKSYSRRTTAQYTFCGRKKIDDFIGIDGGSTSTKGVLLDSNEQVICSAYKLSEENPLIDARDILIELKNKAGASWSEVIVQGIGFTGYAKDLLNEAYGGDTAIVETVAHTLGALKYFPDADVICDVGGQDIKVIILSEGTVKDFRLNTQCSAGNGYYLQSTAERFGYSIDEYAETAFKAEYAPSFNFGCAVFMESDIVNFQQLGWKAHEIMAGLAKVLPLNIWLYVVQEPNLSRLGRVFILQGGTHNNLAVVKTQVDFIRSRVKEAQIYVHPFNEVAGAIGAALEAKRITHTASDPLISHEKRGIEKTKFIGFNSLSAIHYTAKRDEETRCTFCKNNCSRTFITIHSGESSRKYIISNCEKGQAQSGSELKKIIHNIEKKRNNAFNFVQISNKEAFRSYSPPVILHKFKKKKRASIKEAVIGIPKTLNIYSTAPFFGTYFESLGVKKVIFSDFTSEELYRKTGGRGSIDPCFPSKVAISHIYDLIYNKTVTHIFFPCIRMLRDEIYTREFHWACPVVAATPEVVKAAFTLEKNEFFERQIVYFNPVLDMAELDVLERQMYAEFKPVFNISKKENKKAIQCALNIWNNYLYELQTKAEKVLIEIEKKGDIGIVSLGRPYHNDPGINHGILDQLNKCGYPIFTVESLPREGYVINGLFSKELHPLYIQDVWPRSFSENTSLKIWAAKFTARHPNLIAIDLSSFRCGHDAPLYSVIDNIFNQASSPYFTFHEIDENKPIGSIKLRVETIDYFLKRLKEEALECKKSSLAV